MSLCVCACVSAVPRPSSCQCVALNPAKAKPNYRRTATDLAGMLTITEGGGSREGIAWKSHGWTGASQERTTGIREEVGEEERGGTLFQDPLLSLFIIVEVPAKKTQPAIDCTQQGTNGHGLR